MKRVSLKPYHSNSYGEAEEENSYFVKSPGPLPTRTSQESDKKD